MAIRKGRSTVVCRKQSTSMWGSYYCRIDISYILGLLKGNKCCKDPQMVLNKDEIKLKVRKFCWSFSISIKMKGIH